MSNETWNDSSGAYFQDDGPDPFAAPRPKKKASRNLLGFNAMQRMILSFLLMMTVCMLGIMFLFVTGSLNIPL